jgi:hypothetical protein
MTATNELSESLAEDDAGGDVPPFPSPDPDLDTRPEADEPLDSERGYVFANRIRFAWKTDDEELLARIRKSADHLFSELFADAVDTIDRLYLRMRIPLGLGPDGRQRWECDEQGRPVERLDQLTGQDMDQAILDLERIVLNIAPQVNQLRLEALFAQNAAKDAFDDAFPPSGLADDRTARANRSSRQDRWSAYWRYYIYSTANVFFQECKQFIRRLENVRYRQIQSGG